MEDWSMFLVSPPAELLEMQEVPMERAGVSS